MLTVEQGEAQAKTWAGRTADDAQRNIAQNRSLFENTRGGCPFNLMLGHLMRVNPECSPTPRILADRREGYMKGSATEFTDAEVPWNNRNDPTANCYVWAYALTEAARQLQSTHGDLFTSGTEAFWKLSYLLYVLGKRAFYSILKLCDESAADLYAEFKAEVADSHRTYGGWNTVQLNSFVLLHCEYVFEVAKLFGPLQTTHKGKYPVLSDISYRQVFKK